MYRRFNSILFFSIVAASPLIYSCKGTSKATKAANDAAKRELMALRKSNDSLARQLEEMMRAASDSATHKVAEQVRHEFDGFTEDDIKVEMRNGKLYVSLAERLLFPSGSAWLNAKGKSALGRFAGVLNRNAGFALVIEGHTDDVPISSGAYKDNWELSAARSLAIVRTLTQDHKVNGKRLMPCARAEFDPASSNATAEGRAANRRIELILIPENKSF